MLRWYVAIADFAFEPATMFPALHALLAQLPPGPPRRLERTAARGAMGEYWATLASSPVERTGRSR